MSVAPGRYLYYIAKGKYPNHGTPLPYGRFYSWEHADWFLRKRFTWRYSAVVANYTIMCENGCPF